MEHKGNYDDGTKDEKVRWTCDMCGLIEIKNKINRNKRMSC